MNQRTGQLPGFKPLPNAVAKLVTDLSNYIILTLCFVTID